MPDQWGNPVFGDPDRPGIPGIDDQDPGGKAQQEAVNAYRRERDRSGDGGTATQAAVNAAAGAGSANLLTQWMAANGTTAAGAAPEPVRTAGWLYGGAPDSNRMVFEGKPGFQSSNPDIYYGMSPAEKAKFDARYWGGSSLSPVQQQQVDAARAAYAQRGARPSGLMGSLGYGGVANQSTATGAGDLLSQLQQRASYLGFTPQANKDVADRALAAIAQNDPKVVQYAIANNIGTDNWRDAVKGYLAGKDPVGYAREQGWIPKAAPRTIAETVDARTLELMKANGMLSPELEKRVNSQLETQYQLSESGLEGESLGEPGSNTKYWQKLGPGEYGAPEDKGYKLTAEGQRLQQLIGNGRARGIGGEGGGSLYGSRFLPPIPSAQLWNSMFNQAEREGTGQLFQALGLTPGLLTDQIGRLAPPSGGGGLASMLYRRR